MFLLSDTDGDIYAEHNYLRFGDYLLCSQPANTTIICLFCHYCRARIFHLWRLYNGLCLLILMLMGCR
jgi:hypothetical protein